MVQHVGNWPGAVINHTIIEANIKAVAAKDWTVHGREGKVSLADLCARPHSTPTLPRRSSPSSEAESETRTSTV